MAVNKKDRKHIIASWPQRSVPDLARELNLKSAEVEQVLDEAGLKTAPEPSLLGRAKARPISILILAAAVALVYLNSVRNGFHYDDIHSLLQNLGVQVEWTRNPESRSLFWRYFTEPELFSSRPQVAMPRPLLMVTFGINYMISRYDAWSWVLVNILLHMANTIIIYVALCHLSGRQRFALLTALIWAVHPINTETVNYINCRSESLSVFFMLLTMYFFTRSLLEKQRWWLRALALLMFALGLLTKELVITTAGMLVVLDLLFVWPKEKAGKPFGSRLFERALGWYAPVFGVVVLYMIYRMAVLDVAVVKAAVRPFGDNLLIQTRALVSYLRLLFFPFKLNISYENVILDVRMIDFKNNPFVRTGNFPFPLILAMLILYSLLQYGFFTVMRSVFKDKLPPVWIPAVLFAGATVALVLAGLLVDNNVFRFTFPLMTVLLALLVFGSYSLTWMAGPYRGLPAWQAVLALAILNFFITLSITTLVPLNALMNEHRLYLPSLGAAMLLAGLLEVVASNWSKREAAAGKPDRAPGWWPLPIQGMAIAIILLFACQTMAHNLSWYNDYTVWKDSVQNSPAKAQVVSDLGNAYYRTARQMVDRGELAADGQIDKAEKITIEEVFKVPVQLGPIGPETQAQLEDLFMRGLNRAEFLYMWAIRVEPNYFKAWHNLGTINYTYASISIQKKNEDRARQQLDRAVFFFDGATKIAPNGESYNDWASSILSLAKIEKDLGRKEDYWRQAEKLYELAVRYNPEMCKGFTNLGMIKSMLNKSQEALQYLDVAIQCNPLDTQPYYWEGRVYNDTNRTPQAIEVLQRCLQVQSNDPSCIQEMQRAQGGGSLNAPPP